MNNIVIFTSKLSDSVRKGVVAINDAFPAIEIFVVHHIPKKPIRKLAKNQWLNTKKNGWRWIPYQTIDIGCRLVQKFVSKKKTVIGNPGIQFDWKSIRALPNIEYFVCDDLHHKDVIEKVASFNPDLGVSLAAPILKKAIFSIPLLGTINLHKGKVPYYRGMPPAFWELWNKEYEVGCTIHKVESGLDTGNILLESTLPISKYSTVKGIQLGLDEMGVSMMVQSIALMTEGNASWKKQCDGGKTYRQPTLKQQSTLNKRLATSNGQGIVKYVVKQAVLFFYTHILCPIPSWFRGVMNNQRISIVLYHRVNDDFRDSVTVGVEQFDRQMAILAKSYTVVSMEDIINRKVPRNTSKPLVAVTFDDGYLDNYENAVPILLRHGIPATFFISTGIVGTGNGFAHDLDKLGVALPNMSWDQVVEMQRLGFTIGSHTVEHINCGQGNPDVVRGEISKSKQVLEDKLGLKEVIFAYPFGKENDINREILEYVKEVGYSGCTSAYGGYNKGEVDRFNVLRTGIAFNFTDLAFRAVLEGFTAK